MNSQRQPEWKWSGPEGQVAPKDAARQGEALARMMDDYARIPANARASAAASAGAVPETVIPPRYVLEARSTGHNRPSDLGSDV